MLKLKPEERADAGGMLNHPWLRDALGLEMWFWNDQLVVQVKIFLVGQEKFLLLPNNQCLLTIIIIIITIIINQIRNYNCNNHANIPMQVVLVIKANLSIIRVKKLQFTINKFVSHIRFFFLFFFALNNLQNLFVYVFV